MATQTLKGTIRQTPGVVAELPEKLCPGKAKLAEVLGAYEKASTDLSDSQAHLSRSEIDEQSTLNNLQLSIEESSNRLAVSQQSIAVYRARVSNREAAVTRLLPELKTAVAAAHSEYSSLCMNERARRGQILFDRVTKAARLAGNFAREMESILEHSQLIMDIRALEINSGAVTYCGAEQMPSMAQTLLARYETISGKMKETL